MDAKYTYLTKMAWALGDMVCMTALARDLHRAYGGEYRLVFSGHYSNMWQGNPHTLHVKDAEIQPGWHKITLNYKDGIKAAGRGQKLHFLSWFHGRFSEITKLHVPVTEPKGEIYLTRKELEPRYPFRYWLVVAGGKLDMTAKIWHPDRYQEVVDRLAALGMPCVQAGGTFQRNVHPTLRNCHQAVGTTRDERQFCALIANAEGVICGITAAQHIAAVYDKPCVVVAGGREEWWWEAYTNNGQWPESCIVKVPHRFLHTVGLLDCGIGNRHKGCWRNRTVPIERSDLVTEEGRRGLCTRPIRYPLQAVPDCLDRISVDLVIDAVLSYYRAGILPPLRRE